MSAANINSRYTIRKNNCKYKYPCLRCCGEYLPSELERHLKKAHNIAASKTCVWCLDFNKDKQNSLDFIVHREKCFVALQSNFKHQKLLDKRTSVEAAIREKQIQRFIESEQKIQQIREERLSRKRKAKEEVKELKRARMQQKFQNMDKSLYETNTTSNDVNSNKILKQILVSHANRKEIVPLLDTLVATQHVPEVPESCLDNDDDNDEDECLPFGSDYLTEQLEDQQMLDNLTEQCTGNHVYNSPDITKFLKIKKHLLHNMKSHQKYDLPLLYENLHDPTQPPPFLTDPLQVIDKRKRKLFMNMVMFDKRLNIEPLYVKAFLFNENLLWYHISIRVSAWTSFLEFFHMYKNDLFFLEYWCLCSGGKEHHRHMIVVLPKANKSIMKTKFQYMITNAEPCNAKFKREILRQYPLQLVNTINYISSEQSMCLTEKSRTETINSALGITSYFGYKQFTTRAHKRGLCHYFINKPVTPLSALFCMLLLENGIYKYIEAKYKHHLPAQEPSLRLTGGNKSNTCKYFRGRWSVFIRDLAQEKAVVCPLLRNQKLKLVEDVDSFWDDDNAESFLCIGKRIYCIITDDTLLELSRRAWLQHQISNDNCFFFNMGREETFLGKKGQEYMNKTSFEYEHFKNITKIMLNYILKQNEKHQIEFREQKQKYEENKNTLS